MSCLNKKCKKINEVSFFHIIKKKYVTCPGLGQYGAQGGGGTLAGLVEAGVGDFAFVPFGVTPFMGLPAMPVAICWLLMTECASKPETKFLHLHFLIKLQSFISS